MRKTLLAATIILTPALLFSQNLTGTVYADGQPKEGVLVSDGEIITATDSLGKYYIDSRKKNGTVFVITPSGYVAESKKGFQPDFWAPVSASRKKPEVNDFRLISQPQDSFSIIFTADSHLTDDPVKHDFRHYKEMVLPTAARAAEIKKAENRAIYSVNLGDLSHDLFWYQNETQIEKVVEFITGEGFPALTYSVPGNHDNDPAVIGENVDSRAIRRWVAQLGPNTYSINIGDTHWIMLDDVIYRNRPGRGKINTGIKGDRSYKGGLTKSQMTWIAKDLSYVPDTAKIIICTHIPLLIDREPGTLFNNIAQMDTLSQLLAPYGNVTIFSGHAHRNIFQKNQKWDNFTQYVFTATSGVMWQTTNEFQTIGSDGSASGLWVADFSKNSPMKLDYFTYIEGNPMFRTYDLNTVGKYYAENQTVRKMLAEYPKRIDYSKKKFKNNIYVNFWKYEDGCKVEILEDGKPLEVSQVKWEDPLYVLSYYVPEIEKDPVHRKKFETKSNSHAFAAKAASPDSRIEIRVYAPDGTLLATESMDRTKPFDKDAK